MDPSTRQPAFDSAASTASVRCLQGLGPGGGHRAGIVQWLGLRSVTHFCSGEQKLRDPLSPAPKKELPSLLFFQSFSRFVSQGLW